jgi:hypothetical protein
MSVSNVEVVNNTIIVTVTDSNDSITVVSTQRTSASSVTVTPTGNLSSGNVQDALEELQEELDSAESSASADLAAHIADTTDAHAASAITNTASGNLAATNVQTALNELQTDIDTRATSAALTAHIGDTTDAHAASAITNTPSGNLAATTVQAALNELQTDVDGKQATGNYVTALTGDGTASGPGSVALTLATVNGNVGSFGSSTSIPSLTVNGKGLVTAASGNAVVAPAGTLTGATLAAGVTASSLTSVGTIATGVWQGTVVGMTYGGSGKALTPVAGGVVWTDGDSMEVLAAGNSGEVLTSGGSGTPTWTAPLTNPMDSAGDLIVGGASGAATKLDAGTSGQLLMANGAASPTWVSTITGAKTFSGALTLSGGIVGSDGTADATAGNVGQYVESLQSSPASYASSGTFADMANISLTAGDWDVTVITVANANGATVTNIEAGISTTSGNSTSGLTYGVNRSASSGPTSTHNSTASVPSYRMRVSATTTVYAKISADYSVATPQVRGRISARRVR